MKFDAKYPDKTNAQKLNPEKLMGPHEEVEVTSEISQSWRIFPCGSCGVLTGWRFSRPNADYPPSPACSEECAEELKKNVALVEEDRHENVASPSEVVELPSTD